MIPDTSLISKEDIILDDGDIESLEDLDLDFQDQNLSVEELDSKAMMASIANQRITGENIKDTYDNFLHRIHSGKELEIRQELAVKKAQSNLDQLILSETKDPSMTTTDFMGLLIKEQEELYKEFYGGVIEKEVAGALVDGAMSDATRSVVMDREELEPLETKINAGEEITEEDLKKLGSIDRRENLAAALIKFD